MIFFSLLNSIHDHIHTDSTSNDLKINRISDWGGRRSFLCTLTAAQITVTTTVRVLPLGLKDPSLWRLPLLCSLLGGSIVKNP